jgi:hypothetical protein
MALFLMVEGHRSLGKLLEGDACALLKASTCQRQAACAKRTTFCVGLRSIMVQQSASPEAALLGVDVCVTQTGCSLLHCRGRQGGCSQ